MYTTVPTFTETGTRAIRAVETGKGLAVQTRPMARAYRVTDPHRLANQLRAGGFIVDVTRPTIRSLAQSGNWWRHMVLARLPGEEGGYQKGAQFLCAHDGRTSFVAAALSFRLFCQNQFPMVPIRLHHTDPDLDAILEDPVPFARQLADSGAEAAERVESLRGRGDCRPWFRAVEANARRLATKMACAWHEEPSHDWSTWGAIQALTRTQSPSLVRLASLAITEGWEETRGGLVPECCTELLEKLGSRSKRAKAAVTN